MLNKLTDFYVADDFYLLSLPESVKRKRVLFTRLDLEEAKKVARGFADKGVVYSFISKELKEIVQSVLGLQLFDKVGIPPLEWCRAMLIAKYYGRKLREGDKELPKYSRIDWFLVN